MTSCSLLLRQQLHDMRWKIIFRDSTAGQFISRSARQEKGNLSIEYMGLSIWPSSKVFKFSSFYFIS